MSESFLSLLKLNKEGSRVSIAQRGRLLLSVAAIVQVGLIGALCYLQDRAEQYAVRAGRARDLTAAANQVVLKDTALVLALDRSTRLLAADNPAISQKEEALKLALKRLKSLDIKDREDSLGIRHFLDGRHQEQYRKTWRQQCEEADRLTETALKAATAYKELIGLPLPASYDEQARQDRMAYNIRMSTREAKQNLVGANLIDQAARLKDPQEVSLGRIQWEIAIVSLIVVDLGFVAYIGFFFSREILGRLDLMLDNSLRLATGRPLNQRMSGSDEFARVDEAFHTMADLLTESARQQRAIVENARDLICTLDSKGNFLDVSNASLPILGYPPEKLIGGKIITLIYEDDIETTLEVLQKIVNGNDIDSFETRIVKRDGTVVNMLWSVTWSPLEKKIFSVVHDITERKAAERLRQDVVQMVSHDLRSPLANIENFHEMLEAGALGQLNEQGRRLLELADRNSQRMLALIDDLLDIERMESGALELNKSTVSLASVFEQSVQAVFAWSKEKQVALLVEPTDLTVLADSDRLVQVLVNLLTNAVKFSPRGATVNLYAKLQSDSVEINVKDHGRGIPPQMLDSIFDRFKQVNESDAREKHGSGLGLAICKALVGLHGGSIGVKSQEGQGTTFTVQLPLSPLAAARSNH